MMTMAAPGETPRKAGPLTVAKAVFWSFLGIRKGRDHDSDMVRITPVQAIIAGLIGAALFVGTLVLVVKLVLSSAAS
jgi:hypothetical protein